MPRFSGKYPSGYCLRCGKRMQLRLDLSTRPHLCVDRFVGGVPGRVGTGATDPEIAKTNPTTLEEISGRNIRRRTRIARRRYGRMTFPTTRPRGACVVCGEEYCLTSKGTVWKHSCIKAANMSLEDEDGSRTETSS